MRRLWLIALLSITISLSACGDQLGDTPQSGEVSEEAARNNNSIDGSKPTGDKIDACSQITKGEVEAALGKTVMEPTRGDDLVFRKEGTLTSSCMFGGNEGFVSLDIKQQAPASTIAWNAARAYEELKSLIIKGSGGQSSARLEEISGLGADAFAQTREEAENHETTELRILSKRTILTLRVNTLASTSTLEVAKILAGKVISRLQMYEGDVIVAKPETPSTTPKPEPDSDRDRRLKSQEGSRSERRSAKKVERASEQKSGKVASARGGKSVSRRANEPSSRVSQKSATRTANKGKKETTKTARPSQRNKRRT